MDNRSDLGSRSLAVRGRRHRRAAVLLAILAVVAWLGGGTSTGLWPAGGTTLLPVALLGVTGNGQGGDIADLVEKIRAFEAGDEDVEFSTDADGDLGRLYDAVGDLATHVREARRDDAGERYRRELYRITADPEASPEAKIEQLLAVGREHLGVEAAFVSRIDPEEGRLVIETADGSDLVEAGTEADLEAAYCRRTIAGDDILGIHDTGSGDWADDPARDAWDIETYLGGKIEVDGDLRGTVCFVDGESRSVPFSHDEKVFVDLLVRWIGYVFERQARDRRLEWYRRLVESAADPMTILDEEGRHVVINEALAEFHDVSRESVIGAQGAELVSDEATERIESIIRDLLRDEDRDSGRTEIRMTDGTGDEHLFELNLGLLRGDAGGFDGTVATFRDVTERAERERELARTSELLSDAERLGNVGAWEVDGETRELTWTEGTRRIHEVSSGFDPTIESALDFYPPEDRERLREQFRQCIENGDAFEIELRLRTAECDDRWVNNRGERIEDEDGSWLVRGYIQDVTERRELEEQLRERERRLQEHKEYTDDILDAIPDVLYVRDRDNNLVRYNETYPEVTGYSPAELEEVGPLDLVPEEDHEAVREMFSEVFETGESRVESAYVTKSGERIPYEFATVALENPDGEEVFAGIGRDITERTERERELRETNERLEATIEACPAALVAIDAEGTVDLWNPAAEEIFGWSADEVVGEPLPYVPEDRQTEYEEFREAVLSGETLRGVETRRRRKDGSTIDVQLSAAPMRDESGEVIGIMGAFEDISERTEMRRQLQEREQRLSAYKEFTDDLLDAIDDVFYVIDVDGDLRRWNESLSAATGYSDGELADMHALDLFDEGHRETVATAIETVFETGGPERVEIPIQTKAGEHVPYEFVASTLEDLDGEPVLTGIGRDISERVEAEREVSRLIDNVPGLVYRADNEPGWPTKFVSDGVREITGYDPEFLERGEVSWGEDVMVERTEEVWAEVQAALDDREPFTLTYPIETADGERRWVKEQGRGVFAGDGSVEAIEGVVIDVTERVASERELERTRSLLAQSQQLANVGAWEIRVEDGEPVDLTYTDEVYRIHELPHDAEIDVDRAIDFYHPEDRDRIETAVERAIAAGEPYEVEARLITAEGTERWVRSIGDPVREDGDVVAVRGSIQDVTERHERERQVREAKERLQKFIEGSPIGVCALEPDGTVTLWNDAMEDIFGWSAEEVIGEPYPVIPDEKADEHEDLMERAFRGERFSQIELRRETRDGEPIHVELSTAPIRDETDRIVEGVSFVTDITERKEREAELERTRELLEQAQEISGIGGWELDLTTEPPEMTWTEELYDLHGLDTDHPVDLKTVFGFYNPADRDRIEETFETAIETGESYDMEFRVDRDDGDRRWVRAIGEAVERDGEVVALRGSMQDITEEKRRERTLESLHESARGLLQTDTPDAVAGLGVETAREILDESAVGIYLLDSGAGELVPTAVTDEFEALSDGAAPIPVGDEDSAIWNSFATGTRQVFESENGSPADGFTEAVGGGLVVPIGDHGVFVVASRARIDERTRQLAETLVATTVAAFDRLESEAEIRERDAELADRNQRLRRQIQLTNIIRRIDQSLVAATSREEIETAVCEGLAEAEDVTFAWLGGVDRDEAVDPRTWAGDGGSYLDAVSLATTAGAAEPAVATARSGEPTVVENVVSELGGADWQRRALEAGFQSVLAVPVAYEEYRHGVLAVYADRAEAFGDLERTVFAELGRTIANAINAVQTREALHADTLVELDLTFEGAEEFYAQLARAADCEVEHVGVASESAEAARLIFATGADVDLSAVLADLVAVSEYRQLSDTGERRVYEAAVSGTVLPAKLLRHGATARSIRATADGIEATVHVPTSTAVREFVEMLRETYPSVELDARRNVRRATETREEMVTDLLEGLTDRQLEVLRTAYFAGFFDWPRGSSGQEIAEMLDVTQPTVSRHLRLGQKHLLGQLFETDVATAMTAD